MLRSKFYPFVPIKKKKKKSYLFVDGASTEAKSRGKLWALCSCVTSIPRLAQSIIPTQPPHTLCAIVTLQV